MRPIVITDGVLYCPKCEQIKTIDQFYWHQGKPKRPCKECKMGYQQAYYQENQEKVEQYRKQYYQENREEIITKQLQRDQERKPEIATYQKQYRQDNKEEL